MRGPPRGHERGQSRFHPAQSSVEAMIEAAVEREDYGRSRKCSLFYLGHIRTSQLSTTMPTRQGA
jgi:hypothetical protein